MAVTTIVTVAIPVAAALGIAGDILLRPYRRQLAAWWRARGRHYAAGLVLLALIIAGGSVGTIR